MRSLLKNPRVGDIVGLFSAADLALTPVRYLRNQLSLPLALLLMAACQPDPPAAVEPNAATDLAPHACGADGLLDTRLYGAIDADIHWTTSAMTCEGMPRPDGNGARLRFSGPLEDAPDSRTVALILGIPELAEGATDTELPTNVTLVQEGTGRFFGTGDTDGCWTDIVSHELLATETATYLITGTVYCVSPLAELNGNASVTFTELAFSGKIRWEIPE